jgi:hypothetical protein
MFEMWIRWLELCQQTRRSYWGLCYPVWFSELREKEEAEELMRRLNYSEDTKTRRVVIISHE